MKSTKPESGLPGQPITLWPEPYDADTPESVFKFLTECCWTYNEADRSVELIPAHGYIREVTAEWHTCKQVGKPLILQKSRRMIMSWVMRGCELWRSGLRVERGVICGLNYDKAAEHVWRIWWLHNELLKQRAEWNLAPCKPRDGNVGAQRLGQVLLPNGSLIEMLNQDGQSFQGSGYSWVTMEEFSLYRNVDYMWGQAVRVCEGKPGGVPGHVMVVTNASPNPAWRRLKETVEEREQRLRRERSG